MIEAAVHAFKSVAIDDSVRSDAEKKRIGVQQSMNLPNCGVVASKRVCASLVLETVSHIATCTMMLLYVTIKLVELS